MLSALRTPPSKAVTNGECSALRRLLVHNVFLAHGVVRAEEEGCFVVVNNADSLLSFAV